MRTIHLDTPYVGPFEAVGRTADGTLFESLQSVDTDTLRPGVEPELSINSVKWSVDGKGRLTGTARFVLRDTYDLLRARLEGTSPEPPQGQGYREAFVDVTFEGGTRSLAEARGTAKVEARLYDDGTSRGTIRGSVEVPDQYGA